MADTGAVFGGEHSGHYYFRDNYRADSGIIAALVVLEVLQQARPPAVGAAATPLRALRRLGRDQHRAWPTRRPGSKPSRPYTRRRAQDRLDGLTVDHGDWWFNLRPCNTEPLLRLNVEAPDAESCDAHAAEVLTLVAGEAD